MILPVAPKASGELGVDVYQPAFAGITAPNPPPNDGSRVVDASNPVTPVTVTNESYV